LNADELWQAYEQLDRANVRGAGAQKLLTNLVALVRYAIGADALLEPFSVQVDRKFAEWLAQAGRAFTPEQREWLTMIKDHIATTVEIGWDDFDLTPFSDKGGRVKAYTLFGQGLDNLMQELNRVLVA
jgi:type I restriction enzyme R subunit